MCGCEGWGGHEWVSEVGEGNGGGRRRQRNWGREICVIVI